MTFIRTRRAAAAIAAAVCMAIPATAQADASARSDAAQLPGARTAGAATSTLPSQDSYNHTNDHPYDHPGMSRAPKYDAPTTIAIVRPERTIVRDVDEALPLILSGTALALVLASLGFVLVRTRMQARPGNIN